jgi:predicted extracellular nuclease
MSIRSFVRSLLAAVILLTATHASASGVFITEWMYSGTDGEFIEFTNLSGSAVDFTGWSYSDNAQVPGAVPLSSFGFVAAGESVIITEADAAAFRTAWGLAATVQVLGNNTVNI